MNTNLKSARNCFTFVELLVIIGVFAVLTVTLVPAMNKTMEEDRKLACSNSLKKCAAALIAYSMDYDGFIPAPFDGKKRGAARWWTGALMETKYVAEEKDVRCPSMPQLGTNPRSETYGISRLNATGHSDNGYYRNIEKLEVPLATYPLAGDCIAKINGVVRQNYMWDNWYSTVGCLGLIHENACNMSFADGHVAAWTNVEFANYNKVTTRKIYSASDIQGNKVTF